ncbi:MAG TPA: Ig-like domain-containing protein [Gemmatimonadaceae bacterium]|nr:Ig-like domain-containing protein [Gemmatimonadaceae bacterium]
MRAVRALPLVLVVACFPGGVTDANKAAAKFMANTSPATNAVVATVASPTPSVSVKNNGGHPVQGVQVTFTVTNGGGQVTGATATTDQNGIATVGSWTLGTIVGANQLKASIVGASTAPVVFDVYTKAGAVANIVKANDGQSAMVGDPLPQPLVVTAKDAYGNVVSGVAVSFAPAKGSANPVSAQTDANGRAQSVWTMPQTPGSAALSATVGALPAVSFAATATPAGPSSVTKSNDGQVGTVGTALANPVSITVKDKFGNPVSGASVQFAAAGNGLVTPASTITDGSGVASAQWTLPTVAGATSLTATAGTLPAVTFNASANPGAPAKMVASATPQSGTVFTVVGDSVSVTVTDGYDNPISNLAVSFVASGNGVVSPASAATNVSGVARAKWTLPKTAGAASLSATAGGISASFNMTALAGPPATMSSSGSGQTGTVAQALANALNVTVKDQYGNAVSDATVSFTAAGTGSASPASVATNSAGQASTVWTLPTTSGSTSLSAVAGAANASFTATANPDAPTVLSKNPSSDGQSANAGTALPNQIVVSVLDRYNNPVPNVTVSFAPSAGSASPASMLSGLDGQAATTWTLGSTGGAQSMTVSAGSAQVSFSATAIAVNTDPCAVKGSLAVGSTVAGDLSQSQCAFGSNGRKIDLWSLSLNGSTPLDIRLVADNARSFDTYMTMYRGQYSGQTDIIAENDDNGYFDVLTNSGIHLLGGTGQFLVGAGQFSPTSGGYQLSASSWNGLLNACDVVYAVSGTNTNQTLDNNDCTRGTTAARWADRVLVYLHAGETMTVGMSSSQFDAQVELDASVGGVMQTVASDDNSGGGTNARLTYTAPASDMYWVYLTSPHDNSGGAYNLTINVSSPAPTAARTMTLTKSSTSKTGLPAAGTSARKTIDAFNSGVKLQ